jgi:cytochrome P450
MNLMEDPTFVRVHPQGRWTRYFRALNRINGTLQLGTYYLTQSNTMPLSFWFVALISTSEKHYARVMDRICAHVLPNADPSTGTLFDTDALLADPLLQACFQETLRLRTQNGSIRTVFESTTLPVLGKQYHIRKGSIVNIPAQLIHYDPEIYNNPTEFLPERFLGADLESALIKDGEHADKLGEVREKKPPKFYKRGVPVRHYMMPFGGGESLVPPPSMRGSLTRV